MAVGQDGVREHRQSSMVAQLVDQFMAKVEEVAEDDDWRESDGWVGRMILKDPDKGKQALRLRDQRRQDDPYRVARAFRGHHDHERRHLPGSARHGGVEQGGP